MARFPYSFFNNFIARFPSLSNRNFKAIFSNRELVPNFLEIFNDPRFREAIYLASLSLYDELLKVFDYNYQSPKAINSLLKYYNRSSTRCTPFGLFAGVCLGKFDDDFNIPDSFLENFRDTKLDMHFLVSLCNHLNSIPHIKERILFYPNNSIYKIGRKIRYIEYENKEGKRHYIISSAMNSEELKKVLAFSKDGMTIEELTSIIINENITKEEAKEFVEELIINQVLVSELEPNVIGDDYLNVIISILDRINAKKEKEILLEIQNKVINLDDEFVNHPNKYFEIEKLIKKLNLEYDRNFLFQTDLYFNDNVRLPYQWKRELKKGVSFLNKITLPKKNTSLEKFKIAFYERFENEEVSLSYALDVESGIGYLQESIVEGVHPYLDDLNIPNSKQKKDLNFEMNQFHLILNQKLQNAYLKRDYSIELSDRDFVDFNENWDDLPDTLSVTGELISINQQEKLYISNISGNAGRLLGRFCSEKSKIRDLVYEISQKEQSLKSDEILAEIAHLPESRIGNVIRRPQLRTFEIPYLANSILDKEHQIFVEDLYISIRNNNLFLRSKKHNKEVIPYLTNAHNYSNNSLPLYHFLCDYNSQNLRNSLLFDWGDLSKIYNFFPRVEYDNLILSKAKWKIDSEEIKYFKKIIKSDNLEYLFDKIDEWRKLRQIPQWIQWLQGDNSLVINLQNYNLISLFFLSVVTEKEVIIEEFLCHEKLDNTNQFIFSLYKNF